MCDREFHLLSTNLRLKDMLYAMVIPGYVGLGMAYYCVKSRDDALLSLNEDNSNIIVIGDGWEVEKRIS